LIVNKNKDKMKFQCIFHLRLWGAFNDGEEQAA
jgi:hypothetical protein